MKKIKFLIIIVLATAINAIGQVSDDDLFNLSLEELMQIEVTSATKSSVSIQKAPSSIKVFTQEDFNKYSFTTLQDILNTIPGIQVQEYRAGHQNVWVRGVQQRYNNKVLLIIDGVPMRDSYYGHFNIDESLPLSNIEQVEVINGPGSVLYGTNSFSGVISITTKSKGKSLSANYGSFNSFKGSGEFDAKGLYASVNYFRTDGFQPEYNVDGYRRQRSQGADNLSAMLKYEKNGYSLVGSYNSYNYPYKYRSSKKDYFFHRKPIYVTGNKSFKLNEKSSLDATAYYNYYGFSKDKIKYEGVDSDVVKERSTELMNTALLGGNVDYNIELSKHNLLIGTSYQQDMALDMKEHITYDIEEGDISVYEQNVTDPNISRSDIALYVQDMWDITDAILLTTGLRYDILSDFDNQFNYRIGLTGQTPSNFYGKLLYGTSYRVPSYREYLDVASFNPNLTPEYLNTFEAQAGYLFEKGNISLTYFNNNYRDFIQELVVDSVAENGGFREVDDEMAFNFDKRSTSGFELNAALYPAKGLFLNIGAFYMLNADENSGPIPGGIYPISPDLGTVDLTFLSDYTMNFTATYRFLKNYQVGLNAIYFSDRKVPADYQEDVPDEVKNPDNANGFVKVDLFAGAQLANKLDFTVKVRNLFDADIYSPPYGNSAAYDIEWPGITFDVGLRYRF
jgi:outer membrane receptor for ferrienterochelin and colicins